jgi:cellulose synthase/poly-beta-1,6-N-acetylglucosamine synthase-like glycosyltransferase
MGGQVQAEATARARWDRRPSPDTQSGPAPEVSVIMPCLNEEATVGRCVRKARDWFRKEGIVGEVIVVDNGSTDQSRALAVAAGAAVLGPLAEIAIVQIGAASYAPDADDLGGVAPWLPFLYFAAGAVASGLWPALESRSVRQCT